MDLEQSTPVPVQPLQTLSYATSADDGSLSVLQAAAGRMVWLAVFSGLSVASCAMATIPGLGMLSGLVIAITLGIAVWVDLEFREAISRLDESTSPARRALDAIAGCGLLVLMCSMFAGVFVPGGEDQRVYSSITVSFLPMAVSCWRHVLLYRQLARIVRERGGRRLAAGLSGLGVTKFVIETFWLGSCGMAGLQLMMGWEDPVIFFAFAALIGCGVFGILWIWMIVMHALLYSRCKGSR